jgi:hypothetical protein
MRNHFHSFTEMVNELRWAAQMDAAVERMRVEKLKAEALRQNAMRNAPRPPACTRLGYAKVRVEGRTMLAGVFGDPTTTRWEP